jgi:uncharacterized protein
MGRGNNQWIKMLTTLVCGQVFRLTIMSVCLLLLDGVRRMPRPRSCRRVSGEPACRIFRPAGVPASFPEEVVLSIDEFEAIRLADLEGLYHEQAAEKMAISRQTFGRIVEVARGKIARVLVEGLSLRIEGGEIEMAEQRTFRCQQCQNTWSIPFGTGRPDNCPECKSKNVYRSESERGVGKTGQNWGGKHTLRRI